MAHLHCLLLHQHPPQHRLHHLDNLLPLQHPVLQQRDVDGQHDESVRLRALSALVLMHELDHLEQVLHQGNVEVVLLSPQHLPARLSDEVAHTSHAVLEQVVVGLDADVLHDFCELAVEVAALAQTGQVVLGYSEDGVDDDLEEEVVLLLDWVAQFVEQKVEDVVPLFNVKLRPVHEDVDHYSEELLPHCLGDVSLLGLQYLSDGGDARLGDVLVVVVVLLNEAVIVILFLLLVGGVGVDVLGGRGVLLGVGVVEVDEELHQVVGEGRDLLLQEVEQVLEVLDDGDVGLEEGGIYPEDVLEMWLDELDDLVVLQQTVEGVACVDLQEVLLLTAAHQQAVVDQRGGLDKGLLGQLQVVVAGEQLAGPGPDEQVVVLLEEGLHVGSDEQSHLFIEGVGQELHLCGHLREDVEGEFLEFVVAILQAVEEYAEEGGDCVVLLLGEGLAAHEGEEELLEVHPLLLYFQFEVSEVLVVACEVDPEALQAEVDDGLPVLDEQVGRLLVLPVDVGQAGEGELHQLHVPVLVGPVAAALGHDLEDEGLHEGLGVVLVEECGEVAVAGEFGVGVALVDAEEDAEGDLLEGVDVGVLEGHVDVDQLLDEDHQVVDVGLDDGRDVEVQGRAEQLEGHHHYGRRLRVEALEEVGDQSEERDDGPVAEVAQLDLLGDRSPEHRKDRLQALHAPHDLAEVRGLAQYLEGVGDYLGPLPRVVPLREEEDDFLEGGGQLGVSHIFDEH